ncbi:MAG: triose-phosphate isomerase family protein [Patescibacteria group bacterium]
MRKFIIANWKENKTVDEGYTWLTAFRAVAGETEDFSNTILCVSAPLLFPLREKIKELKMNMALGAEDISGFDHGAFTGEVGAFQVRGLVDYVLLGHSERRKFFKETPETIQLKVKQCTKYNLRPIICLSRPEELARIIPDPKGSEIVVYEPPTAISSNGVFHPESLGAVLAAVFRIREHLPPGHPILYGGSINPENAADYLLRSEIGGVLVGAASLDSLSFAAIYKIGKRYETD